MSKTAFITGATSGFGRESARLFAKNGWRVIGTGRRGDRLQALAEELGDCFLPLELDMRDLERLTDVAKLSPPWGDIDLLLNNAGFAPPLETLQEAQLDELTGAIDTNVTSLVALTHALLPRLIERQGAIINISSVAATYPYRGGAVYGGTKAFVRQFSLSLRSDLAGTGVRVTSIEPGMCETEFTLVRTRGDQAASDALYAGADPLTAEDIAGTIWWIATRPPHVNINALELMPVRQSFAGFTVSRKA